VKKNLIEFACSSLTNKTLMKSGFALLSKRERASYRKGDMDIIFGKQKMHKMKMHLHSNRNSSMAFLIKRLAKNGAVFMLHDGEPYAIDTKSFLHTYRDFSIANERNLPRILSGEKILHFSTETVDIPAKARPQL